MSPLRGFHAFQRPVVGKSARTAAALTRTAEPIICSHAEVPNTIRPQAKAPRTTRDNAGSLRVQATTSAVPHGHGEFLVLGRVNNRVVCRIRQEPDEPPRARAALAVRQNG
jgi:hypothetical protein